MWSGGIFGRFKLFIMPDGDTYLTWVNGGSLFFAEVSRGMDQSEKMKLLDAHVNGNPFEVQYAFVGGIVGNRLLVDSNTSAHYASIYLTSLEKDGKGGFILQLHGKDANKVYTLVTDKDARWGWRVASE